MVKMYIIVNDEGEGIVVKQISNKNYIPQPEEIDITDLPEEEKALIRDNPRLYKKV